MIGIYILKSILSIMRGGGYSRPHTPQGFVPTGNVAQLPSQLIPINGPTPHPTHTPVSTITYGIKPTKPIGTTPLQFQPVNGKKLTVGQGLEWR